MEAIIFVGIPASGKSGYYKQHFFDTHMRINYDMLNKRSREQKFLDLCLHSHTKFVINNTNVEREIRAKYIQQIKEHEYTIKCYYFLPNVGRSIAWNSKREGTACVPKIAIFSKLKALDVPELNEGFDELYIVRYERGRLTVDAANDL